MDNQDAPLLPRLTVSHSPDSLVSDVLQHLARDQRISAGRWRVTLQVSLVVACLTLVPVTIHLVAALAQSGVIDVASLTLWDFDVVQASWQDAGLAVLELLPMTSIALALAVLFVAIESLVLLMRSQRRSIFLLQ